MLDWLRQLLWTLFCSFVGAYAYNFWCKSFERAQTQSTSNKEQKETATHNSDGSAEVENDQESISCSKASASISTTEMVIPKPSFLKILYGSQTGKARDYAESFSTHSLTHQVFVKSNILVQDIASYDPEDLFTEEDTLIVLVLSTYTEGGPTDNTRWFFRWLSDAVHDFRIQKDALKHLTYVVVGLGDSVYGEQFCRVAKEVDELLNRLQGKRVYSLGLCDDSADSYKTFADWQEAFLEYLRETKELVPIPSTQPLMFESEDDNESEDDKDQLIDLEDMVGKSSSSKPKIGSSWNDISSSVREQKAMVTPALAKALTKQGYKIIGSHSGVKVCRWTKSMLRGRGGCYKHTFYGIASHRCMEATPSLACANKCVFCWRHHTNPVGTEWRWRTDSPEDIVQGALDAHYRMIRELRGMF